MEAHAPKDHAHPSADAHHGSPDHVPHIVPVAEYFKTWGTLMILTGVTVGASYVNFGSANVWIALLIATVKASLVALYFMHLRHDQRFNSVILGAAVIFLGVFIAFTMFDTETRGRTDAIRADRPVDIKAPFSGTRSEQRAREKVAAEKIAAEKLPVDKAP